MIMSNGEEELTQQRIRAYREELIERMMRVVPEDGTIEPFPSFRLSRSAKHSEAVHAVYEPCFCFVVQGRKKALLGDEVFQYDPGKYLIFTVDLPVIFQVEEASEENPYLGFVIHLDPSLVASVMMESGIQAGKNDVSTKAIDVGSVDANLLDAAVRLVRLIENPNDGKILAPLINREIIYRLLTGGQGARLTHLLASSGETRRISKAVEHLRDHFDEPVNIENIARNLGMSVSGFHHHFKSVTSMSPLQYQKQIRLQEARRLMLGEDLDAASAGFRVGYEDPAYFSRDYKKLFGAPPQRDITRLRSNLEN
jgi:AraC-like DNA-binding protein